jgi:mRNA interferase MazF
MQRTKQSHEPLKMLPSRGELWWCESRVVGDRPCVVLTRDQAIPRLRRVLVAFATTSMRGLSTEVALEPGDDPVRMACVLGLDTPTMVPVEALTRRMGRLSDDRMREVCAALAVAVGCD